MHAESSTKGTLSKETCSEGFELVLGPICPVDPLSGPLGIHEDKDRHRLSIGLELAGDFVGDNAPKTFTHQDIRPVGLHPLHVGEIIGRHGGHIAMRGRYPIGTAGAQPVEGILGAHTPGQAGIDKKFRLASTPTGKEKHRWPLAPCLELE
jgi:hypothetical protein